MTHKAPEFLTMEQCLAMRRGYLVTINMQHIYEGRRSRLAASALFGDNGARHCLDGRGAATLFQRTASGEMPLVQGNVLLDEWLKRATSGRLLVIWSSSAVVRKVTDAYPDIQTIVDERVVRIDSAAAALSSADELAASHPGHWDLIAIALGVPKQELLAQALQHRIAAPIYCIGGSFEILADTFPRSPNWVQAIGMEGVWRLLIEPSTKRVKRLVLSYGAFFALRARSPSLKQLTGMED
jgi:exopolysaccharide biosynthesis WecB/TagA/CpsF family protein